MTKISSGCSPAGNIPYNVCAFHRAVAESVLYVDSNSHVFPGSKIPFDLALVLARHVDHGDSKIRSETKDSRVC